METQCPDLEPVAKQCLAYLEQEERVLKDMIDVLCEVRSALRAGENAILAKAANRQEQYAIRLKSIRVQRVKLRQIIATSLCVPPEEATIRRLSENAPNSYRHPLRLQRDRVADLASEADQLMQSNLVVIVHGIQVFEQILSSLTGSTAVEGRYQSSGRPGASMCRAVFQTRC